MAELFAIDTHKPVQTPLPDAIERELALRIDSSWIVEAPAGSGKTGLLIQRFLKLLADESVSSPEQILAITFTRKATAEMRERILSQLQAAADESETANDFDRETRTLARKALARDRALGWSLLERPGRLRIRTIDSVCAEISNSLPVLSGTGGRRDVVDDASELYNLAARRTFLQLGGPDAVLSKALREVLLHRDGDLGNCERLLASMLRVRDQWGSLVPLRSQELDNTYLDAHVLPKLERALENAICVALTRVTKVFPEHLLRELTLAANSMAHLGAYNRPISPIAICGSKNLSPGERAEDLEHWRALVHLLLTSSNPGWRKRFNKNDVYFETTKSERARLESLIAEFHGRDDLLAELCALDNLPPATYPQDQWIIARELFRVLKHAMVELQLVFAERSECDYSEIALAAKTALRAETGPDDLEAALGMRLQHILVDEMQDTSSSQYELIQMLTAHFDGHSQTVFLVGDPKQSIYLFRQVRVERFLHAMSTGQIGELHLGLLRLTANFRSQATLVADFNRDFNQIFKPSSAPTASDVPFVAAAAVRSPSPETDARHWHANVLPYVRPGETTHPESRAQQSESLYEMRRIIESWRSRPLRDGKPWKIAVLVRARRHLEKIVATLKDESLGAPISYRAVDIDRLKERPEVQDLFALTRALLHPADRTAWLAVLHAPWCGFGLEELYLLAGADNPQFTDETIRSLIVKRGDLLSAEAIARLERIWPVLEAASAARFRAPVAQIVERTWRSLGGDAYLDAAALANARSYLRLLEELEERQGNVSLTALEARLERLFAAPSLDPSAVELLTIHKAKGLEWDVVIVPALERKGGRGHDELLSWVELDTAATDSNEDGAAHFILAPIASKGEETAPLKKWIDGIHKSREAAEDKRLFYVACTRAREELHLFAAPKLSAKSEIKPLAGTLLHAAWPAAETVFAAAQVQAKSSGTLAVFPTPVPAGEEGLALAANAPEAEELPVRSPLLKRLPLSFDATARLTRQISLPRGDQGNFQSLHFARPEGSVAARAFGNAVHAFLELLAKQIANGTAAANLMAAIPGWAPRITAFLRSEGIPPSAAERQTQRVLQALVGTLNDPLGLWLLAPHKDAATEFALTACQQQRSDIRIDRVFRSGPEPLSAEASHLWVVDYKTTTQGAETLEEFLAAEKVKYAPQLEAYASLLKGAEGEPAIRLALYYPLLAKLIWWKSE